MSSRDTVFVDREEELRILKRHWDEGSFKLVIVYGRRRVGKTRLLREFCSRNGVECVFYVSVPQPEEVSRDELIEAISKSLGIKVAGRDVVEVIEGLSCALKGMGRRVTLVLDEFQYMAMNSPGLVGRLQRSIDEVLSKDRSLMLILCGSAVSFMETELLGYKSPLYGRRSVSMKLKPLNPVEVAGFYPGWSFKEVLEAYGVLGGTPAYHRFFDPREDLRSNILKNVLTQGSYLLDEAFNLLRQEVREPRTYFTILSGIAVGVLSPAKLAVMAGVDSRSMGKYVSLLEDLDIVRRVTPLGRRKPVQVRFADNYFRFWFSFVKPYQGLIEAGLSEDVLKIIEGRWSQYMGSVLEDAVMDIVPELRRAGVIKVLPVKYGRWWRKGEEIDLVIVGEGEAQFIEVKWGSLSTKDVRRTLDDLRVKAMKTGIKFRRSHYTLIVREVKGEASLEKDESAYDLNGLGKLLNVGTA